MLTKVAWLMTKAYIILIFAATVIRSEQILYDTSTYFRRRQEERNVWLYRFKYFYHRMCKYVDEVYLRWQNTFLKTLNGRISLLC